MVSQDNKNMDFVQRYHYVRRYTKLLVQLMGLQKMVDVDLSENLLCKVGGYNVQLGLTLDLFNIMNDPKTHYLRRLFLEFVIHLKYINKYVFHAKFGKKGYEFDLQLNALPQVHSSKTYDHIYFASMNNYLNTMFDSFMNKKNVLMIVPLEAKQWPNYDKLLKSKVEVTWLQNELNLDQDEIEEVREHVHEMYATHSNELFSFENLNLSCIESTLKEFLYTFIPPHVIVVNSMVKWLSKIAHKSTSFYVARDRRALENAFLQIGNKLSGNTLILNHGMISSNFDKHLWYRFDSCKEIEVYGQHDKDVIIKKQKALSEHCPQIVVEKRNFFRKAIRKKPDSILYIAGTYLNQHIPFLAHKLLGRYKLVVRLHPGETHLVKKYKRYEKIDNIVIDDLSSPIHSLFEKAEVVLSFSSTSILESIYCGIPTFIVNFRNLDKQLNIYKEAKLNYEEFKEMSVDEDSLLYKLDMIRADKKYQERIKRINQKLYQYFVH